MIERLNTIANAFWFISFKNLDFLHNFANYVFNTWTFRFRCINKFQIGFENIDQNAAKSLSNILEAMIEVRPKVF